VDEITMFAALRPADPAEPGPIRERARARVADALREPSGPARSGRGVGGGRLAAGFRRSATCSTSAGCSRRWPEPGSRPG
jgi:hypothetical protein